MLVDLLLDNRTMPGKLVSTAAVLVIAVVLAILAGRLAAWRVADPYSRYYTRKAAHYLVGLARSWSSRSSGEPSPAASGWSSVWVRPGWPSPCRR